MPWPRGRYMLVDLIIIWEDLEVGANAHVAGEVSWVKWTMIQYVLIYVSLVRRMRNLGTSV